MEAMQRHQYADAAEQFAVLIARYPGERGLLDRARVYLDHCQRELRKQPPAPRTVEERLTAATAALNLDEDREAEKLAQSVLAEEPQQDLALYLLAAIAARREAVDTALDYLGEAIAVSPEVRAQARFDDDFESLRDDDRFRQLVEHPTATEGHNLGRRARKGRAER
jgi:tetratricopeptide (TPR) repeat protein